MGEKVQLNLTHLNIEVVIGASKSHLSSDSFIQSMLEMSQLNEVCYVGVVGLETLGTLCDLDILSIHFFNDCVWVISWCTRYKFIIM